MRNTTLYLFLLFFTVSLTAGCSQVSQHSKNNRANQNHPTVSSQAYRPQTKLSPHKDKQQLTRNRMVKIATSTIGAPYKWGGNNPTQGFDCSGLMSYVHKNALGMNIPRTAAQQRDQSRTINYAQLQPGDMLFFKTGKKSNHVGIYIGNRKFVHAATGSQHVKVATMDSKYWFKRFVKFGTFL
ncbi:MAG: C40 family peptidase [Cocleimonas sp.]